MTHIYYNMLALIKVLIEIFFSLRPTHKLYIRTLRRDRK